MSKYKKVVQNNKLFNGIDEQTIENLLTLNFCIIGDYKKGAVIVQKYDPCSSIGLVLKGSLAIQQFTSSGEVLRIKTLECNDAFGTALYSL